MKRRSISTTAGVIIIAVIIVVAAAASTIILLGPSPGNVSTTSSTSSSSASSSSSSSSSLVSSSSSNSSSSLTPVTFSLGIFADAYHSLIYYGYDHGIYAQNGINLQISPGTGSAATIAALSSGKIQFGILDPASLILAASNQNVTNIRIVTVLFQRTLFGVIYNSQNISKPADLNGKHLNDFQGNSGGVVFKVFAKLNGINYSSIKITYTTPTVNNQVVALGQADFVVIPVYHTVDLGVIAAQNGIRLGVFPYASNGIDIYGFSLATTTDMIQSHPDVVRAVAQATVESIVQAAQNPSAAVAALIKYNTNLNASLILPEFQITIPYISTSSNVTGSTTNIGCVNSTRMQQTINIVAQAYGIATPAAQSQLYTNQFLQCS